MSSRSSLRKRLSLVWVARKGLSCNNISPLISPNFSLCNENWCFQIRSDSRSYEIVLLCSGRLGGSVQPFEIVTFLEERRGKAQMHCSKLTVSSIRETLFHGNLGTTYEKLPSLKLYNDVTLVCTFYPSTVLALKTDGKTGL